MSKYKDPYQFDFTAEWNTRLPEIFERPAVQARFQEILDTYEDLLDLKYESHPDMENGIKPSAYLKEFDEAKKSHRDLNWLRVKQDGINLMFLALAIADELEPEMKWDIIGGDWHAVVTDPARTQVFDMIYSDDLSGAASLIYAEDKETNYHPSAFNEAIPLLEQDSNLDFQNIAKVPEHLARPESGATILHFPKQ